ncbi:MAG: hypothetical protein II370_01630 [Clostridia bacterium]|nr:hypothetical protein [Clostridia bacterium]MBQ5809694.1 hypothetical protein [Clostridia bacterium]MBR0327249.1 hypothetical protein [Clostridia bacterium]
MNKDTNKREYLRPEADIITLQTVEVLTANALSAFNVESNMTDWLNG